MTSYTSRMPRLVAALPRTPASRPRLALSSRNQAGYPWRARRVAVHRPGGVFHAEHDDAEALGRVEQDVLGEQQRRVVERAQVVLVVAVAQHLEATAGALVGDSPGVAQVAALRPTGLVVRCLRRGPGCRSPGGSPDHRRPRGWARGDDPVAVIRLPTPSTDARSASAAMTRASRRVVACSRDMRDSSVGFETGAERLLNQRTGPASAKAAQPLGGLVDLRDRRGDDLGDRAHLVHPADDLAHRHRDASGSSAAEFLRVGVTTSRFCSGIGSSSCPRPRQASVHSS